LVGPLDAVGFAEVVVLGRDEGAIAVGLVGDLFEETILGALHKISTRVNDGIRTAVHREASVLSGELFEPAAPLPAVVAVE
jgi:hypothetical protein